MSSSVSQFSAHVHLYHFNQRKKETKKKKKRQIKPQILLNKKKDIIIHISWCFAGWSPSEISLSNKDRTIKSIQLCPIELIICVHVIKHKRSQLELILLFLFVFGPLTNPNLSVSPLTWKAKAESESSTIPHPFCLNLDRSIIFRSNPIQACTS